MKTNKEKFLELVSAEDPRTMERNRRRIANRWWKRPVQRIHLWFLILLDRFKQATK